MKVASLAFIILFAALTTPTAHGALRGRPGDDGYFHEENHHNEGAAPVESQKHRVLIHGPNGVPAFVKGNLGQIPGLQNLPESQVEAKAQAILQLLVNSNFGAFGNEKLIAKKGKLFKNKKSGSFHARFTQTIDGVPVELAGMVLHADKDGNVFAVNGEFVQGKGVPKKPILTASAALDIALGQSGIAGEGLNWVQDEDATLTIVRGQEDGLGYLAWKRPVSYTKPESGIPQKDYIFADSQKGDLVAMQPTIYGARALKTSNCYQRKLCTAVVSNSSDPIASNDSAIDGAHNFAIKTYEYYWTKFGRDSIDDAGMTLLSRVHYDLNYNNAFWDGKQMTYGDGDGTTFLPLSQDADVVGHELTHGVTERTSGLIYSGESGALNEAMSDIFGSMVDKFSGATGNDIWLIGEDIYTPGQDGDALRDMSNPARFGNYDCYPTRYKGTADNGGVHWNSGIANLAFHLLVTGNAHPRAASCMPVGSSTITGIGFEAAEQIFYNANVGCLTPSSNFAAARYCTADIHGGLNATAVHAAWDAVAVPNNSPSPPIALNDGTSKTGLSGTTGNIQQYTLDVAAGKSVTCTTTGNNGDADLYLLFNVIADPNSSSNDCKSNGSSSNESCTTPAASSSSKLYAAIHAYSTYSSLTLKCTTNVPSFCTLRQTGASCSAGSQCCSGACQKVGRVRSCA